MTSANDLLALRNSVVTAAAHVGLGQVDRTKLATAAVELGRNAIVHGGGGTALVEVCRGAGRDGVRVEVVDQGPGIADIDAAMRDGHSSKGGLGLGLGGARRLVNEFELRSEPGSGTAAVVVRWA